jgi:arabinan endo-1,5-alpha-L-arabinosidase
MLKPTALALLAAASTAVAQRQPLVHDPSTVVSERGDEWFFSTGHGVSMFRQDGKDWKFEGSLFPRGKYPAWQKQAVPGNSGHLWAPDVIRLGDRWCVYYSVSTFGKNTSAIGMASRRKLEVGSEQEPWEDHGIIITSKAADRFNAIDPAVIKDGNKLWMSFGSFWDGLMLIELDPKTGLRKDADAKPIQLAKAPELEAPFIHKEGGWYYLFVNFGKCCRGADSTYEIRVGRSQTITGPYEDRDGKPMKTGGGTLVLGSQENFVGPGHASIFSKANQQWLVHHYYDAADRGRSKFRMLELEWRDGWPACKE